MEPIRKPADQVAVVLIDAPLCAAIARIRCLAALCPIMNDIVSARELRRAAEQVARQRARIPVNGRPVQVEYVIQANDAHAPLRRHLKVQVGPAETPPSLLELRALGSLFGFSSPPQADARCRWDIYKTPDGLEFELVEPIGG